MHSRLSPSSALGALALILLGLASLPSHAADPADRYPDLHLIPWPKSVQMGKGRMPLTAQSRIVASRRDLEPLAKVLSSEIALLTGLKLEVAADPRRPGDIVLEINR